MPKFLFYILLFPFSLGAQTHYACVLDSSFAWNGLRTMANVNVTGSLIGTNDEIFSFGGDAQNIAIIKFTKEGSIDPSFCIAGTQYVYVPGHVGSYATCALMQPDGKIILGGTAADTTTNVYKRTSGDNVIVRLLPDGTLDTSFNKTGIVISDHYRQDDHITALALQPDGKLIICSVSAEPYNIYSSAEGTILLRYNTDGSLDTTFGYLGIINAPAGGASSPNCGAIFLQPDGKIVIGGIEMIEADYFVFMMRFYPNGVADDSFGRYGTVIEGPSYWPAGNYPTYSGVNAMRLLPDGKILVVGSAYGPDTTTDFALIRYSPTGHRDSTFGIAGEIKTNIAGNDAATAMVLTDSSLLLAGISNRGKVGMQAIVRYKLNGDIDSSFGVYGKIAHLLYDGCNTVTAMQLQSTGKIVITGSLQSHGNTCGALARYQAPGNPQPATSAGGDFQLNVYPNPSTGKFVIGAPNYSGVLSLIITNALGQTIWAATHNFKTMSKQYVDISQFPLGLYNVNAINNTGQVQAVKVILY